VDAGRVLAFRRERMIAQWKKHLRDFRKAPAGERFVRRYRAQKGSDRPWARIAFVALGIVLIVGGAILLVIPGPGLLVIAFGGALVAQEFLVVAKALDWLELALRKVYRAGTRIWRQASKLARAAITAGAALCAAGAGYLAWLWFFDS